MSPPTGIGQYSESSCATEGTIVLLFVTRILIYVSGRPAVEGFVADLRGIFRRIYSQILVMAGGSVNLLTRAGIKVTHSAVAVTEGTFFFYLYAYTDMCY
jgi:hypothetical protein